MERRILWHEMAYLVDQVIQAIVVDDFNCIQQPEEKKGGRPFVEDTGFKEFSQFLQSNGLVDLEFVGPRFTWCNNYSDGARVWERIAIIFATPN